MPIVDYPYSLLRGLSDFWTRFFADADQLDALYRGTIIQLGQAYLDLLSSVLSVSFKDAIVLDREYYQLIAIREDEVSFSALDNRWTFNLRTRGQLRVARQPGRRAHRVPRAEPRLRGLEPRGSLSH